MPETPGTHTMKQGGVPVEDRIYDEWADEHYGEWDDDPPRSTAEELAAWYGLIRGREDPPAGRVTVQTS